ncbi:MAG: PQQ-binding-like beta-propeller repeat protein, partial [Gemmatimonadota bacterium]|nr:PQQ-binding-like beta-propeller repeat protein [Gemmatimonadota bacterium]
VLAPGFAPSLIQAQSAAQPWQPVTEQRLLAPQDGDWMSYRRTHDVQGFSPLDEINRTNVDQLRLVWSYSVESSTRWVPTPVVANGIMYVSEGLGRVTAFDAQTGDVRWVHEREYPEDIRVSQAYNKHRGVALYGNYVYWGTADSYLVALDARTGVQLWESRTGDYHTDGGHSHPPLIADGKVFMGRTGGDTGVRGKFGAYDAETGRAEWELYTVPREGEPGWETWTQGVSEVPPLGGAPWNTVSYDPELRLVYFGSGQPYPWSATLRGPGDGLYTNSILAVDADTGELRWHYQVMPQDSWDRAAFESVLVDLEIDGEMRRALIHTSKVGWGVVLDRVTGEFLHAFRIAYDNLITGFEADGKPILDPALVPGPDNVDTGEVFEVCPFYYGGRDLNSPSYSPTTGLYYLGVNNSCMDISYVTEEYRPGGLYRGMRASPKLAPGYDYVGEFVAFDPVSGERAWTYRPEDGSAMTASALATGGGIVFGGNADRQFFALDVDTGEPLWETRLNGDISGAPVTFEVDGKQYLAVGAGGRIAQTQFYARLTNVAVPPGGGVMWVFALP